MRVSTKAPCCSLLEKREGSFRPVLTGAAERFLEAQRQNYEMSPLCQRSGREKLECWGTLQEIFLITPFKLANNASLMLFVAVRCGAIPIVLRLKISSSLDSLVATTAISTMSNLTSTFKGMGTWFGILVFLQDATDLGQYWKFSKIIWFRVPRLPS